MTYTGRDWEEDEDEESDDDDDENEGRKLPLMSAIEHPERGTD